MTKPTASKQAEGQCALRLPDGMRDRLKASAKANGRSMNSEIVLAIKRGLLSPSSIPSPLPEASAHERELDRLDRLTTIVDRARTILGREAARELWHIVGLPHLRTSSRTRIAKPAGPDLFSPPTDDIVVYSGGDERDQAAVERFLKEACLPDREGRVQGAILYAAYHEWAEGGGAPFLTQTMFGRLMQNTPFRRIRVSKVFYCGLRLRSSSGPQPV